mgnify:FL=1
MSFPGGHLEPGESAIDAALREACEELGPIMANVRLVCRGTALPAITGTAVHPVVGLLDGLDVGPPPHDSFALCTAEVERVFALTLRELHDPMLVSLGRNTDTAAVRPSWPVFRGDPHGAEVWGLSAFILRGVLRELLTPLHREHERQGVLCR